MPTDADVRVVEVVDEVVHRGQQREVAADAHGGRGGRPHVGPLLQEGGLQTLLRGRGQLPQRQQHGIAVIAGHDHHLIDIAAQSGSAAAAGGGGGRAYMLGTLGGRSGCCRSGSRAPLRLR